METHYEGYYPPEKIYYDPLTEKRYHSILSEFERIRPPGRLLELGCGKGHFISVAEARGWEAVGLEVSHSALEVLGQLKKERQLKFSVIESPLTEASLPGESFDAVVLIEVIEHLDDPVATLRETRRLLKNRGILYLTTPNAGSLSRVLLGDRWRVIAEEHRILLNPRALSAGLKELGFHPLTVTTKNLDLPEILAAWGGANPEMHPTPADSSSQRLRRGIEENGLLRQAKAGANHLLRLSQAGDTIEVLAVKGEGKGARQA